jgi:hypothetical protein
MDITTPTRREKLPEVPHLPQEELRILANRYSAIKHKSLKRGVEFPWPKFSQYLEVVLARAPANYVPSEFRITHGAGFDFTPEAMTIKRKGGHDPMTRIEAELAVKLLTEDGWRDLSEMAHESELAAAT